jgi:hypothetical protein
MIIGCADLDGFCDGELAEHAERFRDHLAGCERCARVLRGRMQEATVADVAPDVRSADERAGRRGRRRAALVTGAFASALGATAVLVARAVRPEAPRAPPLEVALTVGHIGPVVDGGATRPGDQLQVVARGPRYRAIWIYQDARTLVAACDAPRAIDPTAGPRARGCQVIGDTLALTFALPARGGFAVVTLGGASRLPTPTGALGADIEAAAHIDGSYQIDHLDVD